jgi:hypothetical protein
MRKAQEKWLSAVVGAGLGHWKKLKDLGSSVTMFAKPSWLLGSTARVITVFKDQP